MPKVLNEKSIPRSALPYPTKTSGRTSRILRILNEFIGPVNISCAIDLGCGYGDIIRELTRYDYRAVGVDIYSPALREAKKLSKDAQFVSSSASSICILESSCDLVICYNLLEHLSSKFVHQTLSEASRILKNGGLLFLAVPNKFWILESHYKLPFLSWLPKKMADIYIRLFKKGLEFDAHPYVWIELIKLAEQKGFRVINVTLHVARNFKIFYKQPEYLSPAKYSLAVLMSRLLARIPQKLAGLMANIFFESLFLLCIKDTQSDKTT